MERLYAEGNRLRSFWGSVFLVGCNVRGMAHNPATDVGWGWNGTGYDDPFEFAEQDATRIKGYGFNCVRVSMFWPVLETSSFVYDEDYINAIKEFVRIYNSKGIYIILELNVHGSVGGNPEYLPVSGTKFTDEFLTDTSVSSAREHLKKLWLKLSNTFKGNNGVIYDIFNEPGSFSAFTLPPQEASNLWQNMVDYVVASLRNNGDNHLIFACCCPWARTMHVLSRRYIDKNIIYTPHGYQATDGGGGITSIDINQIRSEVNSEICVPSANLNVPVVLGEFGGLESIDTTEKEAWMRNFLTVANECENIQGWLYWVYISYGGEEPTTSGWQSITREYAPTPTPPILATLGGAGIGGLIGYAVNPADPLTIILSSIAGGTIGYLVGTAIS